MGIPAALVRPPAGGTLRGRGREVGLQSESGRRSGNSPRNSMLGSRTGGTKAVGSKAVGSKAVGSKTRAALSGLRQWQAAGSAWDALASCHRLKCMCNGELPRAPALEKAGVPRRQLDPSRRLVGADRLKRSRQLPVKCEEPAHSLFTFITLDLIPVLV